MLFDQVLEKESPISCITSWLGASRLNSRFGEINNRPKWAIPWVEDDTAMVSPQLWVGRLRRDASDAHASGCTGLMGIHWRTKILSPNFATLAAAGWSQEWDNKLDMRHPSSTGPRDLPCTDFYVEWCQSEFGPGATQPLAELFMSLDSGGPLEAHSFDGAWPRKMPLPSVWIDGPGGIRVDKTLWDEVKTRYEFVDKMAALRPRITGKGNLSRFDYWLISFKFLKAMGQLSCTRGELDDAMEAVAKEKDATQQKELIEEHALPLRIELSRLWETMITYQLAATDTPGELGTIANLEQHTLRNLNFLDLHDAKLEAFLGRPLPQGINISKKFNGTPRIIVPCLRSHLAMNERLALKVIVLDNKKTKSAKLYWRKLGKKEYQTVALKHVSRSVYKVQLGSMNDDFEYYIQAESSVGRKLLFPATAPDINQTVVISDLE